MDITTLIPKDYGYVLLTATLSSAVAQWHGIYTGQYRKPAKIPYPNAYATPEEAKSSKDAYLFNCAQRAHSNFLEHWPIMLVGMGVAGIAYPRTSAVMGTIWCLGRVLYATGYTDSSKETGRGRYRGGWFLLAEVGLQALAGWTGVKMAGLL